MQTFQIDFDGLNIVQIETLQTFEKCEDRRMKIGQTVEAFLHRQHALELHMHLSHTTIVSQSRFPHRLF